MTLLPSILFVSGIAVFVYAYAAYPMLLWVLSLRRRRARAAPMTDWPHVSITLPVYNEEATIRATLESILDLDYPPEKRQILVISDCSSDRTDEIVREFADRGVETIRLPARAGKTAGENAGRRHLRGEILVNTDASVRVKRDALKPLIAQFADPTVGVASGRDVSVARVDDTANLGESGYVGYEMWVRDLETRVGTIVGASGCFYATRMALHMEEVPEALSRDFAAPLIAREHGYRSVSVNDALCFVPRSGSLQQEYRRKVRTMARGLQTLWYKRRLLNPFRYGMFAWMLASHKLTRWLVPWGLLLTVIAIGMAALSAPWGSWLFGGVAAAGVLALIGWRWPASRAMPKVIAMPTYFVSGTLAGLQAWLQAVRGTGNPAWEPTRRAPVDVQQG